MPLPGIPALMVARGSGAVSSLLTGLTVYYALSNVDDATGGGLTLTNNNGVTFGPGKVGDAATFVSTSSQYLSRADNAAFQMGTGDFSIAVWAKYTTGDNADFVFGYGASGSTGYGVALKNDGLGLGFQVFIADGVTQVHSTANHGFSDGSWHLVVATFTRGGNMAVFVDNTSEDTPSIAAVTGSVNNTNGLAIGARYDAQNFYDGSVDELAIANRVWTADERSELWNGGTGITYPF